MTVQLANHCNIAFNKETLSGYYLHWVISAWHTKASIRTRNLAGAYITGISEVGRLKCPHSCHTEH